MTNSKMLCCSCCLCLCWSLNLFFYIHLSISTVQKGGHSPLHDMLLYQPHHELTERYSESSDVNKMSCDAIKPVSDHEDPRRTDRPPSCTGSTFRNSPSPVSLDGTCGKSTVLLPFERASSPVEMDQQPDGDISPRFESPNSVHSGTGPDDGPISVEGVPRHDHFLEQGRSGRNHDESPGNTPTHSSEGPVPQVNAPRHDGPNIPQRFDRYKGSQASFDGPPSHIREPRLDGPPIPYAAPPSRYEGSTGAYDGSGGPVRYPGPRFDAPHRFERFPKPHERPVRFNNPPVSHRPMRCIEPHNMVRFDAQAPIHYDHQMHQNRFVNPPRFDNPHMPAYEEPRFPARLMNFDEQQGAVRFDSPSGGMRFENPVQPEPLRFDTPPVMPRYDPQGPPRFCGPNIPNQLRPQEPTMFDQTQGQAPVINPAVPPPNFNMPPMNSFGGPAQQFPMQQNVSQASNFSVPVPTSSDFQGSFRPAPFPGPGVGSVPQPVSILTQEVLYF